MIWAALSKARRDTLREALDQYVSNEEEHCDLEGIPESTGLVEARAMLEELNLEIARLAEIAAQAAKPRHPLCTCSDVLPGGGWDFCPVHG